MIFILIFVKVVCCLVAFIFCCSLMLFHFTWIKNTFEKNYTVSYLIEWEDFVKPKAFLSEEKIITLGFDEYKDKPESFWDFFAEIKSKSWVVAKFVWDSPTLEEFISALVNMELEVVSVGSFTKTLDENNVKAIIERLVSQLDERRAAEKRKKEESEKKNRLTYTDERLKKSYAAIDQVVEQIDQLLAIWDWNILPETRKKFDDIRWEIAKLRLATNIDKIVDELHDALNLIIETQDYILWKLESQKIYSVVAGSQVTNVEVIREQTRLVKSRILQTIWAPMTTEESSYVSLWYNKLFASFLQKDVLYKFRDKFSIVKWCFWWAELMILFVLLEMVILAVFGENIWVNLSLQRYWIIFLYLGILGWLFRLINTYIRPQSIFTYILRLLIIIWVYFWVMYVLKLILVF